MTLSLGIIERSFNEGVEACARWHEARAAEHEQTSKRLSAEMDRRYFLDKVERHKKYAEDLRHKVKHVEAEGR